MPTQRSIQVLADTHDRKHFSCGKSTLDDFIRKYASQNQKLGYSRTYVAVPVGSRRVDGYYSLSMGSVSFEKLPPDLARRCPKYPMPVAHMGRLAVDSSCQGQGLGEWLLLDAISRMVRASELVAARAIEVWAIDEQAKGFYTAYGFVPFLDSPLHLFLPMDTAIASGHLAT